MRGEHPETRRLIGLSDLPEGERRDVLDHVDRCAECRARLAAADPSALFALLALEPLPADALDRLTGRLEAELDRGAPRRLTRWYVAASVAASLALGGFFGWQAWQSAPTPVVADGHPFPELRELIESRAPATGIELISSPSDADLVDFAVGEAQVVMIFDKELDI